MIEFGKYNSRMPESSTKVRKEAYLRVFTSDLEADADTLGFSPYVRALATFLTQARTIGPLTVSIEGEWGSGKSSFMRQLQLDIERIEKERRFVEG